jgi:predicted RNA-binding Zn ribbon-like protein
MTTTAPRATQDDLETARQLREAIYALAVARIEHAAPPIAPLNVLNRIAADEAPTLKLDRDGQMRLLGSARALLTSVAHEAIRLFGGDQADRIRQCESESCALLFLDLSRAGDRRWCSMSGCGNRAKVAEFRRRKRADQA